MKRGEERGRKVVCRKKRREEEGEKGKDRQSERRGQVDSWFEGEKKCEKGGKKREANGS